MPTNDDSRVNAAFEQGLQLAQSGEYFAAHEAFETAWRGCADAERDFFQGLVHAVVFAYQDGRGRPVGAERQRAKAIRRLAPYAPVHRRLDVGVLLAALRRRETDLREQLVERDPQPPVAVEEEQQPEHDQRRA